MHYKVFYYFERSNDVLSSASAVEMSARDIHRQLLGRFHGEDDYLGLIDSNDNVLQILCEPKAERFWVELPVEAARASWGQIAQEQAPWRYSSRIGRMPARRRIACTREAERPEASRRSIIVYSLVSVDILWSPYLRITVIQ